MFGKRLRELRLKHNLSMDKLVELYNKAYDAKMNKSTLSRYENELQQPAYTVVSRFAHLFKVDIAYMLGATETPDEEYAIYFDENFAIFRKRDTEVLRLPVEIFKTYDKLNELGKKKADEYIRDLAENPKYTKGNDITPSISNDILKDLTTTLQTNTK